MPANYGKTGEQEEYFFAAGHCFYKKAVSEETPGFKIKNAA